MATTNDRVKQAKQILIDAEKALGYDLTDQLYDLLAEDTDWDCRTLSVVTNIIRMERDTTK